MELVAVSEGESMTFDPITETARRITAEESSVVEIQRFASTIESHNGLPDNNPFSSGFGLESMSASVLSLVVSFCC